MKFKNFSLFLFIILNFSCSDGFEPQSYLNRLEVLALKPKDPIYLSSNSILNIEPLLFIPPGKEKDKESWTLCPASKGSRENYECLLQECEIKVDGDLNRNLKELLISKSQCQNALIGFSSRFSGSSASSNFLPKLTIFYKVSLKSGESREALLNLPFDIKSFIPPSFTESSKKISAPKITDILIDGKSIFAPASTNPNLALEKEYKISVEVSSGKNLEEKEVEPLVFFYSTTGQFKPGVTAGKSTKSTWVLEKYGINKKEATLYVVVRDTNGGQDYFQTTFKIGG